jgi:flagellin
MVRRLQVLATQAASANNSGDIAKLNSEATTLTTQIDKLANSTKYNGVNLLNGVDSSSAAVTGTAATNSAVTNSSTNTLTLGGTSVVSSATTATFTATFTGATTADMVADVDLTNINDGTVITAGTALTEANTGMTFTYADGQVGDTSTFTTIDNGTAYAAAGTSDYTAALAFQVGAENNTDNQVAIDFQNKFTTAGLGITGDLSSAANAQTYITTLTTALDTLTTNRALGASVNQLSYVSANLSTNIEQMSSAISTIRDADMAAEMSNFTKSQVMVQAGTAMLAQANQTSQNVLSLFR